jgi:hypothetical protein
MYERMPVGVIADTGFDDPTIASRLVLIACARTMLGVASNAAEPAMKVRRFILAGPKLTAMVARIANGEA